jgi:cellulose synthase/poly-beta-1,6-N-acetylglucosamine synthase-like glycosyltransferase
MMYAFFNLAGLLLCALTLPLVLELFSVTAAALVFRKEDIFAEAQLRLTVVIAAHNEEKLLARTLASIQAPASHANAAQRIHVIAHNCTDATAQIARSAGVEVTELNGPPGKGLALLHAFSHLREEADAFLILDADTTIAPDLITRVRSALHLYDAVQCRYEAAFAPGTKAELAALAFRAINVVRPRGREQLGLSCGILGNGFALRASVLDRVPYNAHSIVEDIEFHIDLVRAGIRVHYLDRAHLHGEIAGGREQHARWEGGRLRLARRKLPRLLLLILRGHLRLIEPALDLACLPQAQAILLLLLMLVFPLFWMRAYALCGLAVIALHIAVAIALAPNPAAATGALLLAPVYILRKLMGTRATLRSAQPQAEWQRADRDTSAQSKH